MGVIFSISLFYQQESHEAHRGLLRDTNIHKLKQQWLVEIENLLKALGLSEYIGS